MLKEVKICIFFENIRNKKCNLPAQFHHSYRNLDGRLQIKHLEQMNQCVQLERNLHHPVLQIKIILHYYQF